MDRCGSSQGCHRSKINVQKQDCQTCPRARLPDVSQQWTVTIYYKLEDTISITFDFYEFTKQETYAIFSPFSWVFDLIFLLASFCVKINKSNI